MDVRIIGFLAQLLSNCALFPASPNGIYTDPKDLGDIHQIWKLDTLIYNAFKCDDIRKDQDGQTEYLIEGTWYVLRQVDGRALGIFQASQILQVIFADGVHVSAGKTKVRDAFWLLAQGIKGKVCASDIAKIFFADDIKKIQEGRQKRSK